MLPLTKDILESSYEYLKATQPFSKWNLPDGEDIKFVVGRTSQMSGWYRFQDNKHEIGVSSHFIGRTISLMEVMAHEIIHLYQADVCMESHNVEHNAAFRKLADQVCKIHGFDPKLF